MFLIRTYIFFYDLETAWIARNYFKYLWIIYWKTTLYLVNAIKQPKHIRIQMVCLNPYSGVILIEGKQGEGIISEEKGGWLNYLSSPDGLKVKRIVTSRNEGLWWSAADLYEYSLSVMSFTDTRKYVTIRVRRFPIAIPKRKLECSITTERFVIPKSFVYRILVCICNVTATVTAL